MYSIGEIISTNRKKKGYSQPELAEILNSKGYSLTNKAISKWEKDGSEPSVTLFMTLCKLFGITDIYEEYFGVNPANPLSYLNTEGKQKAYEYIDLLIGSGKYQKEQNVISFNRKIRLFDIPASAGTGSFLDSEHFEEIEVGQEVPESADFGIRISGDSMEPRFVNGQIVWVHQQESLLNGEIGIFYLDGNAFCKKFQDNEKGLNLISLNKKYAPMEISAENNFKIFGKVVG
jgi:SOS-response transcriptional repressor LexA